MDCSSRVLLGGTAHSVHLATPDLARNDPLATPNLGWPNARRPSPNWHRSGHHCGPTVLTPASLAIDLTWPAHPGPMSWVGEIQNSQPWAMSV